MKYQYEPDALRRKRLESNPWAEDAEYEFLVQRAMECLAFNMTPDYYDNMSVKEHRAWVDAFNQLHPKERK